ncbi:uncharacterized protein LOC132278863 [Cornus florida]|uniref:uncharacterized protein LOC132278863 n=1 Tax=Cornus florida TaxID=4283 RepID=UPI00289E0B09|nr:uncharacterized protein LOC132278863 [Cornus florida]
MNKLEYTLAELLNELVTFEGINKSKGASINYTQSAGPSTSRPKRRGKKKKKDGAKTVVVPNKVIQKDKGKKKVRVEGEGNCFHCGQPGHWKPNCPILRTQGKGKGIPGVQKPQ